MLTLSQLKAKAEEATAAAEEAREQANIAADIKSRIRKPNQKQRKKAADAEAIAQAAETKAQEAIAAVKRAVLNEQAAEKAADAALMDASLADKRKAYSTVAKEAAAVVRNKEAAERAAEAALMDASLADKRKAYASVAAEAAAKADAQNKADAEYKAQADDRAAAKHAKELADARNGVHNTFKNPSVAIKALAAVVNTTKNIGVATVKVLSIAGKVVTAPFKAIANGTVKFASLVASVINKIAINLNSVKKQEKMAALAKEQAEFDAAWGKGMDESLAAVAEAFVREDIAKQAAQLASATSANPKALKAIDAIEAKRAAQDQANIKAIVDAEEKLATEKAAAHNVACKQGPLLLPASAAHAAYLRGDMYEAAKRIAAASQHAVTPEAVALKKIADEQEAAAANERAQAVAKVAATLYTAKQSAAKAAISGPKSPTGAHSLPSRKGSPTGQTAPSIEHIGPGGLPALIPASDDDVRSVSSAPCA